MDTFTILCAVVNFVIQLAIFVRGEATLEVHMLTYRNPTGAASNDHGSCDNRYMNFGNTWRCDTYFLICLKDSAGNSRIDHCNYFYGNAGVYQDHNNIAFSEDMGKVANPFKAHIPDGWPGSIRFNVKINDKDFICAENIDDISVVWTMTAARTVNQSKWSAVQFIPGTRGIDPTRLTVRYRLYCNKNYYNTTCDRHCVAANGPKRHTFCNPATGEELCQPGWEGSQCDVFSDDCVGNKCTNEASCKDGHRTFTCICVPGFTGRYCETNIDECASKPCLNGGTCVDKIDSFACVCKRGYLGSICSHNRCDRDNSPCKNNGTCFINTRDEVRCNCPKAYTGEFCGRDKCLDIVCQNQGTCQGGSCVCRQGYVGQLCDVNLCDEIPCMNGGTCKEGKCSCTRGYTGLYCTRRLRGPVYSMIPQGDHEDSDPPQHGKPVQGGILSRGESTTTSHERAAKTKANTNRGTKGSSSLTKIIGVVSALLVFSMQ